MLKFAHYFAGAERGVGEAVCTQLPYVILHMSYSPNSSYPPLIIAEIVPYIIPYITPFRKFRL